MLDTKSYAHDCKRDRHYNDLFVISWSWDMPDGGRLRREMHKSLRTDLKGAKRFCKKWNLELPPEPFVGPLQPTNGSN